MDKKKFSEMDEWFSEYMRGINVASPKKIIRIGLVKLFISRNLLVTTNVTGSHFVRPSKKGAVK